MGGGGHLLRTESGVWGQGAINLNVRSFSAQKPVSSFTRWKSTWKMVGPTKKIIVRLQPFCMRDFEPLQTLGSVMSHLHCNLETPNIQFILQHRYWDSCWACYSEIIFLEFTSCLFCPNCQLDRLYNHHRNTPVRGSFQKRVAAEGRPTLRVGED